MVREGPSDTGALSFGSFLWANKDKEGLPVNEYLNAVIIFQLSIKLPLLAAGHTCFACPKQVSTKGHPTMPALRAPLRCSLMAGRQKLADAQTGLASCPATSSAARRHRMGNNGYAHISQDTRYPVDP
jgi:hypothetical protein